MFKEHVLRMVAYGKFYSNNLSCQFSIYNVETCFKYIHPAQLQGVYDGLCISLLNLRVEPFQNEFSNVVNQSTTQV